MSSIVAFRERIMEAIKAGVPAVEEVEWYDGMFDEDDILDWSIRTPCAIVSVTDAPTTPHSTGELNAALKILVVIICHDKTSPRDADLTCWTIMESIAVLAKDNAFSDPNVGTPTDIRFKKLPIPAMRRDGISLGITEWRTTLTFGRNSALDRIQILHPDTGQPITQVPPNLSGASVIVRGAGASEREVLGLPYEED